MKEKRMLDILLALLCCLMLFGVKLEAGEPEKAANKRAVTSEVAESEAVKSEVAEPKAAKPGAEKSEAVKQEEAAKSETGEVKAAEKDAPADDFYFEKKSATYINGDLTGPEKKLEVWLKGDRIRFESEDKKEAYSLIMMDKGKSYELDKVQKSYKETSYEVNKMKEMSEKSMVISKLTGEKKKINNWNCYEVFLDTTIQGTKMKATCWLTKDINVSPKLMQKMAKFSQMKLMEELTKYPGYPVLLTMDSTLQGKQVRVVSTLIKVSKDPISASFFKIPFEYTKVSQ
jgi:hypothetical protein